MPLFEYLCTDCGQVNEVLVFGSDDPPVCDTCGSQNQRKLLSAHSALSGTVKNNLPKAGDTACCGSSPDSAGCAGPGSCCGKA